MSERTDKVFCAVRLSLGFLVNTKNGFLKQRIKSGRKHTEFWQLADPQVVAGENGRLLSCVYEKVVGDRVFRVHIVDPYIFSMDLDRPSVVEFCRDFRRKIGLDQLEIADELTISPDGGKIGKLVADRREHLAGVSAILTKYPWLKKP